VQAYGYWEARIWGSIGGYEGACPAFWLPNVANVEIDIMELPGGTCCGIGATCWFTVHQHDYGYKSYGVATMSNGYWGDTYHTYALLWQPNLLCWYIDEIQQFCSKEYVPQTAGYMVLDNEIGLGGNDWNGFPSDDTPYPQYMRIDHVRVWNQVI